MIVGWQKKTHRRISISCSTPFSLNHSPSSPRPIISRTSSSSSDAHECESVKTSANEIHASTSNQVSLSFPFAYPCERTRVRVQFQFKFMLFDCDSMIELERGFEFCSWFSIKTSIAISGFLEVIEREINLRRGVSNRVSGWRFLP